MVVPGDLVTRATLKACHPCALRADAQLPGPDIPHQRMMRQVFNDADAYDVIHFHVGWFEFPLFASDTARIYNHSPWTPGCPKRLGATFPNTLTSRLCRSPMHNDFRCRISRGRERSITVCPKHLCPSRKSNGTMWFSWDASHLRSVPTWQLTLHAVPKSPIRIAAKVDRADLEYMKLSSDLCLICPE